MSESPNPVATIYLVASAEFDIVRKDNIKPFFITESGDPLDKVILGEKICFMEDNEEYNYPPVPEGEGDNRLVKFGYKLIETPKKYEEQHETPKTPYKSCIVEIPDLVEKIEKGKVFLTDELKKHNIEPTEIRICLKSVTVP